MRPLRSPRSFPRCRRLAVALALLTVFAACAGEGTGSETTATDPMDPAAQPEPKLAPAGARRLPVGRRDLAGAFWQERVVVAGGITANGEATDRVDLFDPAENVWSRGVALPAPMHHFGLVVFGDRLWVLGGSVETRDGATPTADVWSLGPGETTWRSEAPLTTARSAPGATVAQRQIVVAGGAGARNRLLDSTELYDPATAAWRRGPDLSTPRDHVAMTTVGDAVWAMTGTHGDVGDTMTVVETLTLPADAWQQIPPGPELDRGGAVAFTFDDRPCLVGGEPWRGPYSINDAFVECLLPERWKRIVNVQNARHGPAAVLVGRTLHLIGGGTQSGRYVVNDHDVVPLELPPPTTLPGG